jgi:5'-nucleotidase
MRGRWASGLFALALLACSTSTQPAASGAAPPKLAPPRLEPAPDFIVSVLGLNDLHGKLAALPAFGGYVKALRSARATNGGVVVVDAGDMFQGTLGSNSVEGRSVILAYNALGVSAATLGNHEFDYGPLDGARSGQAASAQGALRTRLEEAQFPVLSANLLELSSNAPPLWNNLAPSAIIDVGDLHLGVIGVLTTETPTIVMPDYFAGLTVAPPAPIVEAEARKLRARGVDAVLLLAHAGADCRRFDDAHDLTSCDRDSAEIFTLVRALPHGLIDAVVAGHTHAGAAHFVNDVPIVEAYSRGKAFSRVDLTFGGEPRRLLHTRPFPPEPLCSESAELAPCPTHPYDGHAVEPDAAVAALIAPDLDRARLARARALGVDVLDDMPALSDSECALGNAFADAMRAYVPGADVAISNGGGLRANLEKGPLSYGKLYEAMPFDNRLVKITLSAGELGRVLAHHFETDAHGIISLSGVRVKARCLNGKLDLKLFRDDGSALSATAPLSLITSDYVATGGDRLFSILELARSRIEPVGGALVRDALALELAKQQKLDPHSRAVYDADHPRLDLPSGRPIRCAP